MAAPRKYPEELRERAIRLVLEAKKDLSTASGACRRIGEQLGINPETLRGWVQRAEIDAGTRPGTTTSDAERLVTGATTPQVLEAAHIMPYMGGHTNVVQNGLLLRSDIHTLFDRLLLTVRISGSEAITRVAPDIRDATYRELDGQPLRHLPADHRDLPSPSYLHQHAAQCSWL